MEVAHKRNDMQRWCCAAAVATATVKDVCARFTASERRKMLERDVERTVAERGTTERERDAKEQMRKGESHGRGREG